MVFSKILLPTDFSTYADSVLACLLTLRGAEQKVNEDVRPHPIPD